MAALRIFHALPRAAAALLLGLFVSQCATDTPTSPQIRGPDAAAGGGPDPTVKSVVPSASPRDTSISVLVQGSGFDRGSRAVWALNGDTTNVTTRIKVDSTTFVSSKELIADITIDADAPLDLYDVQVLTSSGKKGIGIERFEVTQDITTLPRLSAEGAGAIAINDGGTVVGFGVEKELFYAVRWKKRGRVWTIEKLPAPTNDSPKFAVANDIGEDGSIVGIRFRFDQGDNQDPHAMVWPASGGVMDLGPGVGLSVSAEGTVVGSRFDFDNSGPFNSQAVVWTRTLGRTWDKGQLLPRLPNGHGTVAQGISPGGNIVVGVAADDSDVQHAVKWRLVGGQWQAPTLLHGGIGSVVALSVNASGDVTGQGFPCEEFFGCPQQTMFWPSTGGRLDLGALGIHESIHIAGLSNSAEVVGFATTPDFRQFAFMWRPKAGTVIDLGTLLGDEGSEARDINNRKQVVGASFGPLGTRAILWRVR